jgi:AcrR family transcriptional regulator
VTTDMPLPPGRERKRTAPPRRPLDYAQIIDAALKVLDAEGLDGVSMRRVAQELGTGAASLYAHVKNKDELVEGVVDRIFGDVKLPPPRTGDDWRAELTELAHAAREVLAAHRDVAGALWGRIPLGPNAMVLSERVFGVMRRIGLPDQVIAWAGPLLFDYVSADAYEGNVYAQRFGDEAGAAHYFQSVRNYFSRLPPDRFPNMVALGNSLTTGGSDERFEFGLNVIIDGLAAQARSEALGDRGGDA